MQKRKYDNKGRAMLRSLCKGNGLDVGCNKRKISKNCQGVDFDKANNPDILGEMDAIGVVDESQDFVVGSHVLEHAKEVPHTLKEWVRALKPGGEIGVIVPHGEYARWQTLGDSSGTHYQLFTPKTLELFFLNAGLIDVETTVYDRPTAYQQVPGIFCKGVKP